MKQITIYNLPFRNLHIKLKFSQNNTFWNTYPKALNVTMGELLTGVTSLSAVAYKLAELSPLGLLSVEVIDNATGSGLELQCDVVSKKVKA